MHQDLRCLVRSLEVAFCYEYSLSFSEPEHGIATSEKIYDAPYTCHTPAHVESCFLRESDAILIHAEQYAYRGNMYEFPHLRSQINDEEYEYGMFSSP